MKSAAQYAIDRIRQMAPPTGDARRAMMDERLSPLAATMAAPGAGEIVDRMAFLPFGQDAQGNTDFAVPQMALDAYDAFMMPGRIMQGQQFTNDEMQSAAFDLVGVGMGGAGLATAPRDALTTFGGVGAKTADLAAQARAAEMLAAGDDAADIWRSTGWWQGPDGQWRFEIDDSQASFANPPDSRSWPAYFNDAEKERYGRNFNPSLLSNKEFNDYLKFRSEVEQAYNASNATHRNFGDLVAHDELFSAYPDMSNLQTMRLESMGRSGSYSPDHDVIQYGDVSNLDGLLGLVSHEGQHAVQAREGFARGGDPSSPQGVGLSGSDAQFDAARNAYEASMGDADLLRQLGIDAPEGNLKPWEDLTRREQVEWLERGRMNAYHRLFGEVEARAVQERMNMTPEERLATPPWESMDVPEDQWILRGLLK